MCVRGVASLFFNTLVSCFGLVSGEAELAEAFRVARLLGRSLKVHCTQSETREGAGVADTPVILDVPGVSVTIDGKKFVPGQEVQAYALNGIPSVFSKLDHWNWRRATFGRHDSPTAVYTLVYTPAVTPAAADEEASAVSLPSDGATKDGEVRGGGNAGS